ncbi:hypothetical protein E2562_024557 [Oryza meyeriana var. granulata]|uniref:DUF3615 domain-containing protein n=1 Tax=Oryza meyeriana var. granulata TaxID=110450 RepID=A0A6G1BNS7_9ORYZ|nr:hypothetical protein E2562_024557 [Oryza meyeriana var. granulata]
MKEPSYKLDVICGVMESSRFSYDGSPLYHATFLASNADSTCTSSQTKATLFFAEFWEASFTNVVQLKPSSCRRRCSICENEVSMIIHPPSGGHSGDIKGSIDIYPSAAHRVLTISSAHLLGSDTYYDPDTYFPPPIGNDNPVMAWTPTAQPSLRQERQRVW